MASATFRPQPAGLLTLNDLSRKLHHVIDEIAPRELTTEQRATYHGDLTRFVVLLRDNPGAYAKGMAK